jgi:hypothetical protein
VGGSGERRGEELIAFFTTEAQRNGEKKMRREVDGLFTTGYKRTWSSNFMRIKKYLLILLIAGAVTYFAFDCWLYFRFKPDEDHIEKVVDKYKHVNEDSIPETLIRSYEKLHPGASTNNVFTDLAWCVFSQFHNDAYPQINLAYEIAHKGTKETISIANQLDNKLSQKKCIYIFLDKVYYGNSIKGIHSASKEYFGKELRELTETECMQLIMVQKNPPKYLSEYRISPIQPDTINELEIGNLINCFAIHPTFSKKFNFDSDEFGIGSHQVKVYSKHERFLARIDGQNIEYKEKKTLNTVINDTDSLSWSTYSPVEIKYYKSKNNELLLIQYQSSPCTGTGCAVRYFLIHDFQTRTQTLFGTYRNYYEEIFELYEFNNDNHPEMIIPSFPNDLQCRYNCTYIYKAYTFKNGKFSIPQNSLKRDIGLTIKNQHIRELNWFDELELCGSGFSNP